MAKRYITAQQKKQVEKRANNLCEYCKCNREYASHTFNIEHITPIAAGGSDEMNNLALACSGCNGCKASRLTATDPLSKHNVALFHPRQQNWNDHFIWSSDYTEVVGLTPTGRATIDALRLNRSGVVNLRRVMLLANLHPPTENAN